MLKYSVCKVCGNPISYNGVGRPKQYCEKCKKEARRIQRAKYMQAYRLKIRKNLFN
jgi:Zn finger protein HypA/HybF involved in hydrogenase expression